MPETDPYHFPPDLTELLIDTIPRLSKSKVGVLDFFRSWGVPPAMTADLRGQVTADRDSISKFAIARTVIKRINEGGDKTLGARRQVLQRVTQFEDFSACWPEDQLKARGLIAEIQKIINVKDSFTRMQQAEEQHRHAAARHRQKQAEEKQRKHAHRDDLRRQLASLGSMTDARKRGLALERVLNEIFKLDGISVRESFTISTDSGVIGEQVDGLIGMDGQLIMVEAKWHSEPIGRGDVTSHLVRLFSRAGVRGLFVSASAYTTPAVEECERALAHRVIVLAEVNELLMLLERSDASVSDWLRAKIMAAAIDRKPLHRPGFALDPIPAK
jgi:restriction system protein